MISGKWTLFSGFCVVTLMLVGCGGGDENASGSVSAPAESQTEKTTPSEEKTRPTQVAKVTEPGKKLPPPPAAIGGTSEVEMPKEGTPLWYLLKIRELRSNPGPKTTKLAELRAYRRERNEEVCEMATQVIAQTHSNPKMADAFNLAVEELMEARYQNALQGDEEDIGLLYEEAEALKNRDADSMAAMIASHALVRFAHTNAKLHAAKQPQWIVEFSRRARQFAGQYPDETTKALPLLTAAALTAELHDQREEAIACHALLADKFSETPQGKFSVGVLRRLNLEGQKLEFAGPTLEGGFINLEDYPDRVVLIIFWRSDDKDFASQLPELKTLYEKYHKFGFEIIGVCMDEDELALNTWIEEQNVDWRQIFFVNKEERSWRNPVAQYYGVRSVPTMWLVDHNGVVQDADVSAETLEGQLRDRLLSLREKIKSADSDGKAN